MVDLNKRNDPGASASTERTTGGLEEARPTRRRVIQGAGLLAGALAAPAIIRGSRAEASTTSSLFTLGVASGDPRSHSVVLWTRLAPDPLNGGGMGADPVAVSWSIATDEAMLNVIASGTVDALPENGHAVHVVPTGLPSNTWLYYRFQALGERSRIGRTRTFPLFNDPADRMRFAVVSCQHYEQGFYPAWRDIANWRAQQDRELDLDFVVHTGDYIYENAATSSPIDPERVHSNAEIFSVTEYRDRYAQYKLDPNLQRAHANYPFLVIPDDHEVDNNYAGLIAEEGAAYTGADFIRRRRNAYQVYAETMPLRRENRNGSRHNKLTLFRRFNFGALADIHMLDTRQFRTDQPAGDGFGSTDPNSVAVEPVFGEQLFDADGILDPAATLMGATQERWLEDGLRRSRARWNVIANQVMVTRWNLIEAGRLQIALNPGIPDAQKQQILALLANVGEFLNVDAWDGYQAARQRLFDVLETVRPNNPVIVTGDIHAAWAANLVKDFSDPGSQMLAAEFVCTSISSTFLALDPRPAHVLVKASVQKDNPHIPYFNALFRGYCLCDVDASRFRTTFRAVGDPAALADPRPLALVPLETSPVATDAVYDIQAGFNQPGSRKRIVERFVRTFPTPF